MIAALAPLLVFAAFVLLLLVSLSTPIIHVIYLFRLTANVGSSTSGANGSVNFGVWGYCVSTIRVAVVGINRNKNGQCSPARLGYTFDSTVANALNADEIENSISRTVTAALVLHPIACGLTFLTLLISLFILRRGSNGTSRLPSLLTLGIGSLAAILTTAVFLIDVIAVAIVRKRVRDASDGDLDLVWGNGVWMTLGAAVALWLAMLGACCGICGCGGRRHRKTTAY
ncbi:actin cortical patch SUR7/pH-response regulator pali [Crassisporium funariophilum]|nr:actin cortical patch SUR7/pH-response regulator pali [Crassisporium funariophilum]